MTTVETYEPCECNADVVRLKQDIADRDFWIERLEQEKHENIFVLRKHIASLEEKVKILKAEAADRQNALIQAEEKIECLQKHLKDSVFSDVAIKAHRIECIDRSVQCQLTPPVGSPRRLERERTDSARETFFSREGSDISDSAISGHRLPLHLTLHSISRITSNGDDWDPTPRSGSRPDPPFFVPSPCPTCGSGDSSQNSRLRQVITIPLVSADETKLHVSSQDAETQYLEGDISESPHSVDPVERHAALNLVKKIGGDMVTDGHFVPVFITGLAASLCVNILRSA